MTQISLPWPPRGLWPNYRNHWASLSRATRAYKQAAWAEAQPIGKVTWPRVSVHMTFCPPDNRRRDMDNMIAAMKAGIDGISKAIGVDDSRFVLGFELGPKTERGAVLVEVREAL